MLASNPLPALWHFACEWWFGYEVVLSLFIVGALIEARRPVQRLQSRAAIRLNLAYSAIYTALGQAARPLTMAASVWIVNLLGGGLIVLPAHGWGVLVSVLALVLTIDLLEYLFHRLQHAWPLLWRMHSLHHSAESLNVTVTTRHYWFEALLKGFLLFPLVGVLFKVDPSIAGIAALVFLPVNFFAHMNLRINLGRVVTWVNNPQYHRLHHSRRAEHFNKNFTQMLPLWDRLFGTMWTPAPHEWPPTGLDGDAEPASVLVALYWPLRRRIAGDPAASAPRVAE
ncbi:sterol desaturase family protein [Paraburkholderia elongata]|uniref:Fatty acid hydroxylase family protein n=1 Tax=Paraburkholderia elongata TaxID=2675747 RepID=A0A972NUR7_9BURK|nr:sterol desaturase family protein [Paraburkholderia elongata]NPT60081.1 fatty acid hydroxylase family protein [Paraburkholderia elongata]